MIQYSVALRVLIPLIGVVWINRSLVLNFCEPKIESYLIMMMRTFFNSGCGETKRTRLSQGNVFVLGLFYG